MHASKEVVSVGVDMFIVDVKYTDLGEGILWMSYVYSIKSSGRSSLYHKYAKNDVQYTYLLCAHACFSDFRMLILDC